MPHLPATPGPGAKGIKIDLGVDPRAVGTLVPQDLPDLLERGSVAQHSGGQRMTKQVGRAPARSFDPGLCKRTTNDMPNRSRRLKTVNRGIPPHEQTARRTTRPTGLQIRDERFADFMGQGQNIVPAPLADHGHLGVAPVDVVQGQADDLAGPQSEVRQQQQNAVVAPASDRAAVATGEHRFDLMRLQPPGQTRQASGSDPGYSIGDIRGHDPGLIQIPREAAQSRDMDPCRRRAVGLAGVENESVDVLETQRPKIDRPGLETVTEKGSNGRQVSLHGVQAGSAFVEEEAPIPLYGVPDRVIV